MPISPYGGGIIDRTISDEALAKRLCGVKETFRLLPDDLINLFNIAVGCYSPLTGFMTEFECESVMQSNKLPCGLDWTVPITLRAESRPKKSEVGLVDQNGITVGILEIESIFEIDNKKFCQSIFGTTDRNHPGVRQAMIKPTTCVGGRIYLDESRIGKMRYFRTPRETRDWLKKTKKNTFTAFSTRNICHIGHEYLHGIALETTDMLGINVITGAEVKGSFLPDVVFDTYEYLISCFYPEGRVFLNNLRLPPIYAGPKEVFLQAIILQNYGFTHFIVGRDHAGVNSFYPKYGSQQIFEELRSLNIHILPLLEPRFCKVCEKVTTEKSCQHRDDDIMYLNGGEVRRSLLEKRYDKLEVLIRKGLREMLVKMFEERPEIFFYEKDHILAIF